jgi:hypothetical protein
MNFRLQLNTFLGLSHLIHELGAQTYPSVPRFKVRLSQRIKYLNCGNVFGPSDKYSGGKVRAEKYCVRGPNNQNTPAQYRTGSGFRTAQHSTVQNKQTNNKRNQKTRLVETLTRSSSDISKLASIFNDFFFFYSF